MLIAIGSDHGGFRLKEDIKEFLTEQGYEFRDFGTYSTDSVDYPDFARAVAQAVASGEYTHGILMCGTGVGISIAANKVKGIRAAHCTDEYTAQMSREHNDANILAMGERITGFGLARSIVGRWLTTEFVGGRHAKRVCKIADLEA